MGNAFELNLVIHSIMVPYYVQFNAIVQCAYSYLSQVLKLAIIKWTFWV